MVVLWLGLLLLSSVSKHNIWSYYGWVCRCCQSVNTTCGFNQVGLLVVVVRQYSQYVDVLWLGLTLLSSVRKTQYMVVLLLGLLLLSFVSRHNMWWYYGWVYCCCRLSVDTICGGIMVGFVVWCRQSLCFV